MGKVIFITGVSSGFGKAMAGALSGQGHVVYGSSRQPGFQMEGVQVLKVDVTLFEEVEQAVQTIIGKEGRIDVLINNAGFGLGGALEDFTEEEAKMEMETIVLGAYRCCRSVLPHMRRQKSGMILSIGSIAGLMGIPFQGFYSASKFGLEGFMQSLRYEVSPYGIKVVMINPGDFNTGFTANRRLVKKTLQSDYRDRFNGTLQVVEKDEGQGLEASVLARKVLAVVNSRNPRHRYIVASFDQKLAVFLNKVLPAKWFFRIIGSHYKTH